MNFPTPITVVSPTDCWPSSCSSASTSVDRSELESSSVISGNNAQAQPPIGLGIINGVFEPRALYNACLNGENLPPPVGSSVGIDANRAVPREAGDSVFQLLLHTPACRFRTNKEEMIKCLILNGANPLARDRLGDNALHVLAGSAERNSRRLLLFLLAGGTPELRDIRSVCIRGLNHRNNFGDTPLIVAVLYNELFAARLFLRQGADQSIRGERNMTALDFAMERGFQAMSELLNNFKAGIRRN